MKRVIKSSFKTSVITYIHATTYIQVNLYSRKRWWYGWKILINNSVLRTYFSYYLLVLMFTSFNVSKKQLINPNDFENALLVCTRSTIIHNLADNSQCMLEFDR